MLTRVVSPRPWAALVAAFVATTALTWSWSSSVRGAANVTYWVLVLVLGISFAALALKFVPVRRWFVVSAAACAALGVTALWSIAPETTLKETVKFGAVVAVAAFVGALLRSSREAGGALARALGFLTPFALVLTAAVAVAAVWAESVPREGGVSGFFNGSNALSIFLSLTFPFALLHPFVRQRTAVALVLSAATAFFATLSGGRSGLIALLLSVVVIGLATRRWVALAPAGALVVGAALAIAWAPTVPTVGEPLAATELHEGTIRRVDESSPTSGPGPRQVDDFLGGDRAGGQSLVSSLLGARDEAWAESVRIARERPVAGHGFGTGNLLFDRYGSRERFTYFVGGFATGTTPHNSYVQSVLELGLLAAVLFLAPLLLATYAALRLLWRGRAAPWQAAFAAALAAAVFSALFDSTLTQAGALTLLSWISIAAMLGIALNRGPAPETEEAVGARLERAPEPRHNTADDLGPHEVRV